MKNDMNCWIWIYLSSSIDSVFAFLGNNYKVTTDHTTFISYVVSLILLKEVKNLYFQIGQLKRSEKGLLLIWHCCHEQNLMGLFSSVSIEKNFFSFLLSASPFSIVRGYNLLAPVQTCCVALQLWPASFILFTNSN